jgi:acyl-CoA thioesterase FadM
VRYRFEITRKETLVAEGSISAAHVAITPEGIKAVPLPPTLAQKLSTLITSSP